MSEFLFGVRRGPAPSAAIAKKLERIGKAHGCDITWAGGQAWWAGPNRGEPFDSRLRDEVAQACADAGLEEWCPGTRPGRPLTRSEPIDQQIAIKVTSGQRARLDALAASRGVTLGVVVRDAIDRHIAPWCDLNGVHLDMSEVAAISQDPDDSCSENSRPR